MCSVAVSSGFPADSGLTEPGSSPEFAGGEQSGFAAANVSHRQPPAGHHQEPSTSQPMRSFQRPQTANEILKLLLMMDYKF